MKVYSTITKTRKRKATSAIVAALFLLAGSAVAAFLIFSGADGSGSGSFSAAQQSSALTFTGTSSPQLAGPGDQQPMNLNVKNNDPGAAHSLVGNLGAAFTSTPPECAAHLSVLPYGQGSVNGVNPVPAGFSGGTVAPITVKADATTPMSCASGSFSVVFSGTTS